MKQQMMLQTFGQNRKSSEALFFKLPATASGGGNEGSERERDARGEGHQF